MKISDLINGLEYIKEKEGDIIVLEGRVLFWDSLDYLPDNIEIDKRVKTMIQDNQNKYDYAEGYEDSKSHEKLRRVKAFLL